MPPLLLGVIAKTKALFAGRVGPPLLQPYYDLVKLFRKGSVFSTTTTWVFRAGPVVGLVTAALARAAPPAVRRPERPVSFPGDLILLAYLLGLGRFFTAAAALDTGSAFEGMGAAREVTFACLAEPAFFLGLLVLAKLSGSLQLAGMLGGSLGTHWPTAGASLALVVLQLVHRPAGRELAHPLRRPEHAPGADHDPRGHGARPQRPGLRGMILYGAALKLFVFGACSSAWRSRSRRVRGSDWPSSSRRCWSSRSWSASWNRAWPGCD